MNLAQKAFFTLLAFGSIALAVAWIRAARLGPDSNRPTVGAMAVGGITSFLDTLGVGSFAPTTALFKVFHIVDDELIPGTLNVGLAAPTIIAAAIFVRSIEIDPSLLAATISSAVLGAWLGAGVVSRLPRRSIQFGMGVALLIAVAFFIAVTLGVLPGGGDALSLDGWRFSVAVAACFVFGGLMTLGLGLYAPCMIVLALLGMQPIAAFPIMMGSCALLQCVAGIKFLRTRRMDFSASLSTTLAGVCGVAIAAGIVKALPLAALRILVIVVATYGAVAMLHSATRQRIGTTASETA
jgi:uncharacterized membrane protein YfcA